eukprot:XP_017948071.1 PREDICTED: uncharacterized protein LOC108646211 [Xenopus tropicalis]
MARIVLNTSYRCLKDVTSATELIETCFVAVATPTIVLTDIFHAKNDSEVQDSDIETYVSVYAYVTDQNATRRMRKNFASIVTHNVTASDICYNMTCNVSDIPVCIQARVTKSTDPHPVCSRMTSQCIIITTTMSCNHTILAPSLAKHVPMPRGWFCSCRNNSFNYIPANISGGPCALTRLSLAVPTAHPRQPTQAQRPNRGTDYEYIPRIARHLMSKSEIIALGFSLVGVPGLTVYQGKQINEIACIIVKSINAASIAIANLLPDIGDARKAVLQNRAAINYLFFKHNHGCEYFEGLFCFNFVVIIIICLIIIQCVSSLIHMCCSCYNDITLSVITS